MSNELIEYTDVAALVDGRYRIDNGISWLEGLTRRVVDDSAPAGATVLFTPRVGREQSHVSIFVGGRPLALIDVHVAAGTNEAAAPLSELDHVLVKAVEQWRLRPAGRPTDTKHERVQSDPVGRSPRHVSWLRSAA